jgi:hypothetical protein
MGFRFQRRLGLGNLVRFNLSKSGLSLSLGPRGMSYNVGVIGPRADQPSTLSIGVPGTGLSYRATIDGGSPDQQNPKPPVYHHASFQLGLTSTQRLPFRPHLPHLIRR